MAGLKSLIQKASVTSFKGRGGDVVPQSGDYTKDMIGLGSVLNSEQVVNSKNAKSITVDTSGNRPSAGNLGKIYIETDTGSIKYDDGSNWIEIGSSSGGVKSFNGRTGDVSPQSGDYSSSDVGLGNVLNSEQVVNNKDVISFTADTSGNRPSAGTLGRIFVETDTGLILYDDGSSWIEIGSAGGSSGSKSGISTDLSDQKGSILGTSFSSIYTAPTGDSSKRFIVKSVHVTNTTGNKQSANLRLVKSGGATYNMGNGIPIEPNASIEMSKRIKVLEPGDSIEMSASNSNSVGGIVTIAEYSDNTLFSVGASAQGSLTEIYSDSNNNSTIDSILVSNVTSNTVTATVMWQDSNGNDIAPISSAIDIGANTTVEMMENDKFLPSGNKITAKGNNTDVFDVVVSGKKLG